MTQKIICLLLATILSIPTFPQALFSHPWKGRKVAFLGDSITDPRNNGSKKKYWNYLQEWLNITPLVYGRSGWQWNGMTTQADSLFPQHGNDFDAIIIFCGTNDFNDAVPIGSWFEEHPDTVLSAKHKPKAMVARIKRTPIYTDSTFCGRINKALSHIKKMWPSKQIVLLTPLHRAFFYGSETNIQPTEEYQNECGEYVDRYVECVKEAGNIWSVPVLDVNATSGLYPVFDENATYFHNKETDRLHPNDLGHQRLARTLYYQLSTLPCIWE